MPFAIALPRVCVARSATDASASRQLSRSFWMKDQRLRRSTSFGSNGSPTRVESRWTWTSENDGSSRRPAPSTCSSRPSTLSELPLPCGSIDAMTPSDTRTSTGSPPQGRTLLIIRSRIPSASLRSGMREGPGRFPGPRPSSTTSHCLTSFSSGGKGTRTPNPLLAKQVRYQLRHTPVRADSLHRIGVLRPLLLPAAIAAAEDSQSPRCKNCSPQQGEQSSHAAPSWMRGPKRT